MIIHFNLIYWLEVLEVPLQKNANNLKMQSIMYRTASYDNANTILFHISGRLTSVRTSIMSVMVTKEQCKMLL